MTLDRPDLSALRPLDGAHARGASSGVSRLTVLGAIELCDAGGSPVVTVVAQPKRLALLAYLALARRGGYHRRDELVALFWPELDDARARAALRKSLHFLRQALGPALLPGRGTEDVGVDAGALWCDAVAFEAAADAGDATQALALYRGELLPGLFVEDAPEFTRWLDGERARLRQLATRVALAEARRRAAAQPEEAIALFRRAIALGADEAAVREALELVERSQGAAEALREYDRYRAALRAELELDPQPETRALAARIRRDADARAARPTPASNAPVSAPDDLAAHGATQSPSAAATLPASVSSEPAPPPASPPGSPPASPPIAVAPASHRPSPALAPRWPSSLGGPRALAAIALALALLVPLALLARRLRAPAPPVIAVGTIHDYVDDSAVARALPDLLATNLERVPGLRVIASTRVMELLAQDHALPRPSSAAVAAAARRAGATQLLEGALYRLPGDEYRLDLRRVSLIDGTVVETRTAVAPDPFLVVDRATAEVVAGMRRGPAALRVADVTTHSLVAYRMYREGLGAYYGGKAQAAASLFSAALDEDSTFAMAAYYSAMANSGDAGIAHRDLDRAARLVGRVSDRERLLILGTRAFWRNEPARLAYAESLATRYPDDPAGARLYGESLLWAGRFADAIVQLQRAVATDSLALQRNLVPCRGCEALGLISAAYLMMDSTAAAERVARRLYAARPTSVTGMVPLLTVLESEGRLAEWSALRSRAAEAGWSPEMLPVSTAVMRIRRGEFAAADALLRGVIASGTPGLRGEARWYLVLSLRNQGRWREALGVARDMGAEAAANGDSAAFAQDFLPEAIVRSEMGDGVRAAAIFERIALLLRGRVSPASTARQLAWNLTHAAGALAHAGRLERLGRLSDSIRTLGAQSAYGRDARLYHHVDGVRQAAVGRTDSAVASFRAAIFSTTGGYTRTNLELGRLLLRLDRPSEAAAILAPALRGGLEASALYATHTDLHAALGEALLRSGDRRGAAEHLGWAIRALDHADPQFAAERARLRTLRDRALGGRVVLRPSPAGPR